LETQFNRRFSTFRNRLSVPMSMAKQSNILEDYTDRLSSDFGNRLSIGTVQLLRRSKVSNCLICLKFPTLKLVTCDSVGIFRFSVDQG